jgi:hypothetical protein
MIAARQTSVEADLDWAMGNDCGQVEALKATEQP